MGCHPPPPPDLLRCFRRAPLCCSRWGAPWSPVGTGCSVSSSPLSWWCCWWRRQAVTVGSDDSHSDLAVPWLLGLVRHGSVNWGVGGGLSPKLALTAPVRHHGLKLPQAATCCSSARRIKRPPRRRGPAAVPRHPAVAHVVSSSWSLRARATVGHVVPDEDFYSAALPVVCARTCFNLGGAHGAAMQGGSAGVHSVIHPATSRFLLWPPLWTTVVTARVPPLFWKCFVFPVGAH
ncbi:unnamed protein product [Urochloa humidicola]